MSDFVKNAVPSKVPGMRVNVEQFIELHNEGKCVLLDIRTKEEVAVWQVNFAIKIPADELPERLNELPKDKIIVTACPKTDRSIMARTWLAEQGYDTKYLMGGLLALMERLKGGKAKDIKI